MDNSERGYFDITLEKEVYSIEIKKSNNEKVDTITFTVFNKNHISNSVYQNSFNLEQLIGFSEIFKLCGNINDAFNIILQTLKGNEIKLIKDDKIYLSISLKMPNSKNQDIKIGLEKAEAKDHDIIEIICKNLSDIQEKNKNLEEEVKLLRKENQKLNELLNKQEEPPTLIDVMAKKIYKIKIFINKRFITSFNWIWFKRWF